MKKSNVTRRSKILAMLVSTEGVFGRHPIINFTTATTVTHTANPNYCHCYYSNYHYHTSITTTDISPIIYYLSLLLRLLLPLYYYSTATTYYYITKRKEPTTLSLRIHSHMRERAFYFGNYVQRIRPRPVAQSSWFLFSLKRYENSFCRFLICSKTFIPSQYRRIRSYVTECAFAIKKEKEIGLRQRVEHSFQSVPQLYLLSTYLEVYTEIYIYCIYIYIYDECIIKRKSRRVQVIKKKTQFYHVNGAIGC